ncbi:hypothetical protein FS749_001346 [Ceratobasidium sp. UAMH 11750]|nr:hypothetical protein FS749_001346 [Ceratobasidium sp. UAMH 11750]
MPLNAWGKLLKSPLSPGAHAFPYNESSLESQGTASELHLDQQKPRHLRTISSRLNPSVKALSNASADSFYTADQDRLSDSSQPPDSSQPVHTKDTTRITLRERESAAKTFADRAWNEDPTLIAREKLLGWLGSP